MPNFSASFRAIFANSSVSSSKVGISTQCATIGTISAIAPSRRIDASSKSSAIAIALSPSHASNSPSFFSVFLLYVGFDRNIAATTPSYASTESSSSATTKAPSLANDLAFKAFLAPNTSCNGMCRDFCSPNTTTESRHTTSAPLLSFSAPVRYNVKHFSFAANMARATCFELSSIPSDAKTDSTRLPVANTVALRFDTSSASKDITRNPIS